MPDGLRSRFPAPDSSAFLLLSVLLCADKRALSAWERWSRRFTLDSLDLASHRLLMTALPTLERLGGAVADLPRLQGLRKRSYCANVMLWRTGRAVTEMFGAQGIGTMLHKGLPLSVTYYVPGERYSFDVDVLVRQADYVQAQAILQHHPDFVRSNAGRTADPIHDDGEEWRFGTWRVDLHARPCHEFTLPSESEARFWARAQPIDALPDAADWSYPPLVPAPEDLILQQAVQLTRRDVEPYVFVDLARVLARHGSTLDWDMVVSEAFAHRISLRLHLVLEYLNDFFGVAVPGSVMDRLRAAALRFERREMELMLAGTRWRGLYWDWFRFCRSKSGRNGNHLNAVQFPGYLYRARGRPGPLEAVRRAASSLGRALGKD